MRRFIFQGFRICMAFLVLAALPACNTVDGVGKDMESAGRTIQDKF